MRIVFMGTPDFAAQALEALVAAGHEVVAAVTQPDKPKGRSGQMQYSPVKECALQHGIEVFQPVKIKQEEEVERLRAYHADIFIVAAFGQILTKEILDMPHYGCVNIHASLLPKYRGAAPIQQAIIDGESETGVTIMQMDEGIDTGDMLTRVVVPIAPNDNAETLFDKLAEAGARLIVETLPQIEAGTLTPQPQDNAQASYVKMMKKSRGEIDWTQDAVVLERLVRGLYPWPGTYTFFQGKTVKIWSCEVTEGQGEAGTILTVGKDYFDVAAGKGALRIRELQLEGKKRMDTRSFLLGNPWKAGMRLGKEI